MEEKLISVIVPLYNCEKYIKDCLQSILTNTYKNLEIIVVNDGSTDKSLEEAQKVKDDRVTIITQKNGGLSDARNKGLSLAKGEYINFVDADDVVASDFYEYLVKVLNDFSDADMVVCDLLRFPDRELPIFNDVDSETVVLDSMIQKMEHLKNNGDVFDVQMNKLFKREIFNDIRFPVGLVHEDAYVIFNEMLNCRKLVYLKKKMYGYRTNREGSITFTRTEKNLEGKFEARKNVIKQTSKAYKEGKIDSITEKKWIDYELSKLLEETVYLYTILPKTRFTKAYYSQAKEMYKKYKSYLEHKTKYMIYFTFPKLSCELIRRKAKKNGRIKD